MIADFLRGEYIYDGHTLIGADGDVGDMGHEAHIMQTICVTYAEQLVQIAEDSIDKSKISKELLQELEESKMKVKKDIRSDDYDSFDVFNLYSYIQKINPQLVSNEKLKEGMWALRGGDARKYGCKYLGYIIIRQNNFEVWELNQETVKKIVNASHEIAQDYMDILDEKDIEEQEVEVYSYKTNQSRNYTLGELEQGQILKTATAPTTKASMYIPPPSVTKKLSPTQRHQLLYTSESFSFKEWLNNISKK